MVLRDDEGRVKPDQAVSLTSAGAIGGGFWGMLIGLIFLNPLIGAAVDAAAGGISGKFRDLGVEDKVMKEMATSLKPRSGACSCLFVALPWRA